MSHLVPPTLTAAEQKAILRATAANIRDHTIFSMALGAGLRLAELVGLNVGDVFAPDGTPRVRVRIRPEIARGGRAADVFLPDRLVTKLTRFWRWKRGRGEDFDPAAPVLCNQSREEIAFNIPIDGTHCVSLASAARPCDGGVPVIPSSA